MLKQTLWQRPQELKIITISCFSDLIEEVGTAVTLLLHSFNFTV